MSSLFGKNIFTEAFRQFDEKAFFTQLHDQVKNKSYFETYRGFKTTLLWLSYLFNIASALSASYAVYWLTHQLTGYSVVAWSIAAIFLFFLEKIKRKSSTEVWQLLFFKRNVAVGWLALSLTCLALSLASSSFGVKEGTETLGPGADLIATDSTAQRYRQRIAKLESENLRLEQQRNPEGEIYWPAQKEKEQNKKMLAELQKRVLELDQKLEGNNAKLSQRYQRDIALTAWTLVWITVAMEILFELCIAWIWYYYYRSYVEYKAIIGLPAEAEGTSTPSPPLPSLSPDAQLINQMVLEALEQLRGSDSISPSSPSISPSSNGQSGTGIDPVMEASPPIGFFTTAQKALRRSGGMEHPHHESVQTCTDLYREETDRYTILHSYRRGGQTYHTRYTRNQIQSRISQYEREVAEAINRELSAVVIANRRRWLTYWQGKMVELDQRQKQI